MAPIVTWPVFIPRTERRKRGRIALPGVAMRGVGVLAEVIERIIAETTLDASLAQTSCTGKRLYGVKTRLAQELPGQQGPQQRPRRETRLCATVATTGEVALQLQSPRRV